MKIKKKEKSIFKRNLYFNYNCKMFQFYFLKLRCFILDNKKFFFLFFKIKFSFVTSLKSLHDFISLPLNIYCVYLSNPNNGLFGCKP